MGIPAGAVDGGAIEVGEQPVIVALGDGIELVVVATGAVQRGSQPDRAQGLGLVEEVIDAVLLRDAPAFAIDGVVAEKSGGEALLEGGFGQKIPGKLPEGELVEGKVAVERFHNPVAPRPHGSFAVALVAVLESA